MYFQLRTDALKIAFGLESKEALNGEPQPLRVKSDRAKAAQEMAMTLAFECGTACIPKGSK